MTKRDLPAAPAVPSVSFRTRTSAKAFELWNGALQFQEDDAKSDNVISVLDVIGRDFWTGEGVTAKRVSAALRRIGERDVVVNINSPGGDFFEGLAIYNILRQHKGAVTVNILGMAASAAATIAMAGDVVNIAKAGFMMVHNVQSIAVGEKTDMRNWADIMEQFDEAAVGVYADRTGISEGEMAALLDKETWMTGKKAVEDGFADNFLSADQVSAATQSAEDKLGWTMRRMENLLKQGGASRQEVKTVLTEFTQAMRDAGPGTQDAAPRTERLFGSLIESINQKTEGLNNHAI